MDWTQILFLFFANASLIIWFRAESRADYRHMDAKLEANRELIRSIHSETQAQIKAIHEEMKDFHGRLCAIEERSRK